MIKWIIYFKYNGDDIQRSRQTSNKDFTQQFSDALRPIQQVCHDVKEYS